MCHMMLGSRLGLWYKREAKSFSYGCCMQQESLCHCVHYSSSTFHQILRVSVSLSDKLGHGSNRALLTNHPFLRLSPYSHLLPSRFACYFMLACLRSPKIAVSPPPTRYVGEISILVVTRRVGTLPPSFLHNHSVANCWVRNCKMTSTTITARRLGRWAPQTVLSRRKRRLVMILEEEGKMKSWIFSP
jgi:hypothetical protein